MVGLCQTRVVVQKKKIDIHTHFFFIKLIKRKQTKLSIWVKNNWLKRTRM